MDEQVRPQLCVRRLGTSVTVALALAITGCGQPSEASVAAGLDDGGDVEVVDHGFDPAQLGGLLGGRAPDALVLLPADLRRDGLIARLRSIRPEPRLVVAAESISGVEVRRLVREGAAVCLPMGASAAALRAAVWFAAAGRRGYLDDRTISAGGAGLHGAHGTQSPGLDLAALRRLTRRQIEVYDLLRLAMRATEIADTLGIAPTTVHSHTADVYSCLGVMDRRDLHGLPMI